MRHAFEKGDFAETVTLGRHAIRNGKASPDVHFYYGAALVAVGRDPEGFAEVDSAVAADADLAKKAAVVLGELAQREGLAVLDRARRLRKAFELDHTVDLGRDRFAVAATYYEDRDYEHAAAIYSDAVSKFPDAPECEVAYARLSESYRALGDEEKSRAAMETLVKRFPASGEARGAAANLNDIMYQEAQTHYNAGEYDQAITIAGELVSKADNRSLQQKARFLLGQSYEAKGDRAAAYEAYREVIRNDRGDSGQIVERARSRIEVLQEAGLR
ncbi:MAG TPA: tetratricopeptide repeat protein [Candidatus Krumholzibacteria bacterium]